MGVRRRFAGLPGAALSRFGSQHARLLIPALRADRNGDFGSSSGFIKRALAKGVGGFILFGGGAASVFTLINQLRASSPNPLLICSDLERGAGQQFSGATPLPPAAAIASLGDLSATRRAGETTAREAHAIGIDCIFAPVADIDLEPLNPIIGTRAFGETPSQVTAQITAWMEGCHEGGCIACAKHFPGHGRTTGDSHLVLPTVYSSAAELDLDLDPFRALISGGLQAVMTAHVAYFAYDRSGAPATLSPAILNDLLRENLGFGGVVITDGLSMAGLTNDLTESEAAVAALHAGCDLLLYPSDLEAVLSGVSGAMDDGSLHSDRIAEGVARLDEVLRGRHPTPGEWGLAADRDWARDLALRTITILAGEPRLKPTPLRLVQVDDDRRASVQPSSRPLAKVLAEEGFELSASGQTLIAIYADVHAGKATLGISAEALAVVEQELSSAPEAIVILFGHPRLQRQLAKVKHLLCAWGGEPIMQRAAARRLRSTA